MLGNLSSIQKAVAGVVVVSGVIGWIFALIQTGKIDSLPTREDLASAQDEIAQVRRDRMVAQIERDQMQFQVDATKSLEELTAALATGKAELLTLQSQIEGSQAELETLESNVQKQQALPKGNTLRFKTTARARVRAGPGTDTDEVAVVPAGKIIQVFEIVEAGTWYKVGAMGYIFHELLEPVDKELVE